MTLPRRAWCSCTIIDCLKGTERASACKDIIRQAERGQIEIVVSTLAMAEVAKISDPDQGDEGRIREFFGRDYIIAIPVDQRVATRARSLVQKYPALHGADAVHFATAIMHSVPVLETFDGALLNLSRREGQPRRIEIRHPHYDGGEQAEFRSGLGL